MNNTLRVVVVQAACGILVFSSHCAAAADPGAAERQKACELKTPQATINYLLYLPKDYQQKPSWPLLLFLHGAGGRGDDLGMVRKIGVAKLVEGGQGFPFVVVSPQSPKSERGWDPAKLTALLDEIVAKFKVDKDRIYVTGQSMGGFGTWSLAAHAPDRFAAIVPICGGGDPTKAKEIAHIPAWVFHGGKDQTVPLERSQKMVDALKASGANVKFTIYPEAGHDAWTQTYANPQLYEWLLQKRLPKKADDSKK